MGLLYLGTALTWEEAKKYADHVRTHGISQFLNIWDKTKDKKDVELLWGDEVAPAPPSFLASTFTGFSFRLNTWSLALTTQARRRMQRYH